MTKLNVILDKVITYTDPNLPRGKVTFVENKPVRLSKQPSGKSAEEMLKKALEFANQGMLANESHLYDEFTEGMYCAYEDMAAHLEMLIKEAKQNG